MIQIGYCANVHPAHTVAEMIQNLKSYTRPIKQQVAPQTQFGVGLWFSSSVANELKNHQALREFGDFLDEADLVAYTLNGFPFGDFHQPVVKHNVYQPTWAEPERLHYTLRLAQIHSQLLPSTRSGSISTLPLGWRQPSWKPVDCWRHPSTSFQQFCLDCAQNLRTCAIALSEIEETTGHRIRLCLEPEPGCVIDRSEDVINFWNRYLLSNDRQLNSKLHRHLAICHDVCHSAVMFEPQAKAFEAYAEHGIEIGKVQISSAVEARFIDRDSSSQLLEQLTEFGEPKYLHQTTVKLSDGTFRHFEDLPLALANHNPCADAIWRVHFHVPIFASELGQLTTTQPEIDACLKLIKSNNHLPIDIEIETYAWNVLPKAQTNLSLIAGIAAEIQWLNKRF